MTRAVGFRIDAETQTLLDRLAAHHTMNRATALRYAVRQAARLDGLLALPICEPEAGALPWPPARRAPTRGRRAGGRRVYAFSLPVTQGG